MMRKFFLLLLMAFFAIMLSAGSYPVKPGEKIMFFGDSITHDGRYTALLQLIIDSRGISGSDVMNAGISGQTTAGGLRRIQLDVIDRKPDRVFILFGMNDVGRGMLYRIDSPENFKRRKAGLEKFTANQKKLIKLLKDAGITPVLMTPTAYDQYQKDGKSDRCNEPGLSDIAQIVRTLAKDEKLDLIELHPVMTGVLKKYPELRFCGRDLVHPSAAGHALMAALIAEQLGFAAPVAELTIAADGKVNSRFVHISNLQITPAKISFRYAPERLAVNLAKQFSDVEKVYPFTEKFNREILKVTGLTAGSYTLAADGRILGTFTASDLAKGINLATLDTPNKKRAENAFKTAMQIHSCNSKLRTLEQCRQIAFNSKFYKGTPDPENFNVIAEVLDKWRDSYGEKWLYRKYYGYVISSYRKNAPNEEKVAKEREKFRLLLEQQTHPAAYVITLEKTK